MSSRRRSFGSSARSSSSSARRELDLCGRDLGERRAADGRQVRDLGLLAERPVRAFGERPRHAEHLGCLGRAGRAGSAPRSRPARRACTPSVGCRRRETPARAGTCRAPRRTGARRGARARGRVAPRPAPVGCAEPGCEEHRLDAEPPASQSSSSPEGTTSPRSIWLTYCFVNRPSASSSCVSPASRRRARTRLPTPADAPTCSASLTTIPPPDPSPEMPDVPAQYGLCRGDRACGRCGPEASARVCQRRRAIPRITTIQNRRHDPVAIISPQFHSNT